MFDFILGYEKIAPATWACLSSLIMLGLFFKFNRFWSVRNVDLILLILLAPGLLLVDRGERQLARLQPSAAEMQSSESASDQPQPAATPDSGQSEIQHDSPEVKRAKSVARSGYIWLFLIGAILLLRMLFDPLFVRRPVLEPNLSIGGLTFLACSMLFFMLADVANSNPSPDQLDGPREAMKIVNRDANGNDPDRFLRRGPGLALFHVFPILPTYVINERQGEVNQDDEKVRVGYEAVAKIMTILFLIGIVGGIVAVGYQHYGDLHLGIGMAAIFLMLPYTSQFAGHVLHVLPAMLIVWAFAAYQRPVISGILIGLAAGVAYYPIFLLPLWFSFYWFRGSGRFLIGVLGSLSIVIASLVFLVESPGEFFAQLQAMFGFSIPKVKGLEGIWAVGWDAWFRLPLLVAFLGLSFSFVFWPGRKSVGVLLAYSCAIMVAVQFWHGFGGGTHMAWYLPLAIFTFFRPQLQDRDAVSEVAEYRWPKRRKDSDETTSEVPVDGNGSRNPGQLSDNRPNPTLNR